MDFRLKERKPGRVGLNMGLLPGTYQGTESIPEVTYISEDVFWLLEVAIRKHCEALTSYSHWGHTPISRAQWEAILVEWKNLAIAADLAKLPIQIPALRALPTHARREFLRDFRRNCAKLSKLILRLTLHVRDLLATCDEISVLGV